MAWFFIIGLISVVAFIVWAMGIAGAKTSNSSVGTGSITALVLVVYAFFFLGITAAFSVHIVDAKEVGVVKTFGKITGQTDCTTDSRTGLQKCGGLTILYPWQTLDTWNIRETYVFAEGEKCKNNTVDKCLDAGDKDQQPVYITPKVNIQVDPENVQKLSATVGTNYVDRIVRPLMNTTIKKVTSDYTATDVHLKRDTIEKEVQKRLQTELTGYSIQVTRVTFENVDFADSYNQQIALKAAQIQKALEEENKVAVKEAEARQKAVEAEGEAQKARIAAQGAADARRIAAQAEADANNLINASLTGNVLEYRLAQTLGDNVQFLPSGTGVIIDPATLLKK